MAAEDTYIHLLAGGAGGTAGAVLTCPLEVVKTRLQSSCSTFKPVPTQYVRKVPLVPNAVPAAASFATCATGGSTHTVTTARAGAARNGTAVESTRLIACLRHIIQNEGARGLFKGLGPNLVGVAPSRAVYFCAYAQAKSMCNDVLPPDTPIVHICSASAAGFTASTLTNPIWYLKTRLQLDQKRSGSLTVRQCIRNTYRQLGISGFYKGITASYYGISETVIHFVIYEALKVRLREMKGLDMTNDNMDEERSVTDFLEYMVAGATSKTIATCIAYPHEVARTRLREEGTLYVGFWQTLRHVFHTEGYPGLYRGLATQLVRQIPNTAVMMATYEAVVYLCHKHLHQNSDTDDDDSY